MRITKMLIALAIVLGVSTTLIIKPMDDTIISEANIPSETEVIGVTLVETDDYDTLCKHRDLCNERMQTAHDIAEQARSLGYEETHIIIQIAQQEWAAAHDAKIHYDNKIAIIEEEIRLAEEKRKQEEDKKWEVEAGEYPVATQVWRLLKSYGYSDIICAGILGNMMRECGGDTLNLNPNANNGHHFGLCQWSKTYHYNAWGRSVEGQIEYLVNSADFTMFNGCTTPEAAAEVFCWQYERPGKSDPAHKRLANARKAYNYFTN